MGEDFLDHVEGTAEVGGNDCIELLERDLINASVLHAHACGIVDEDIDASVLLSYIGNQGMHCLSACQVESMEPCISAISLDVINDLLSALHVSACHDYVCCFLSAELCDTDTDSTGGTGYDYYLIF